MRIEGSFYTSETHKANDMEEQDILSKLNDSQRAAVTYCDGPQLVIAGAGSGKTRVLTYKIAYLLQRGMAPWNILALTFTNKAAREMKERIGQLVGIDQARRLQMGTFHSVFSHILRVEATTLGFQPNFTIYDQNDSRSLVKNIIKEMELDDKVYKAASVADRISMAKNHLLLPQAYAQSGWAHDDVQRKQPALSQIYMRYSERCRSANAMDFDDLLVYTYLLFHEHADVRAKYVERFHYVLVDEYQDTNYAQQSIVTLLTQQSGRICVVGDDAQSIYSFRGANIDNILNFQKEYSGARLFKLEQNYRSTQHIVEAANSLIRHNERQIPKDVFSRNDPGERIVLKPTYSDKEEAIVVCNDIRRLRRKDKCNYRDFAILYRTNSQSRAFEEQMLKDNIPYRIYGGLSFYQRKEIKDVIAYYRLVVNPDDEEALRRIINYPARGIGDTTVRRVAEVANERGVSLWAVVCQPEMYGVKISKGTIAKLDAFRLLVEQWQARHASEDAYTLGHAIIMESGISKDIYSSNKADDLSRQENIEEFLAGLQDFVENRKEEGMGDQVALEHYLQDVALLTDLDSESGNDDDRVVLMTIHSAKGLEFPTVFIVGLEENIFPSPMSANSARELEEERRLLYVAITRAEHHCIMTCAQNRWRYGKMEYDTPSRFIRDIDPALLQVEGERPGASAADVYGQHGGARNRSMAMGEGSRSSSWMQNPHPVASQFRADPKPRVVPPRRNEPPVESLSPAFQRALQSASGGRFRPVAHTSSPSSSSSGAPLSVGNVIEHQRFGVGTVTQIEGTGENIKATVEFRNTGTKQLLLKFAKYKVIG